MNKNKTSHKKTSMFAFVPLGIVVALGLLFFYSIGDENDTLPSMLIDKPAPGLDLVPLAGMKDANGEDTPLLTDESLRSGRVSLINFWASWCVPCRQEHPVLMKFQRDYPEIPIFGLNYKDKPENAQQFLEELGNAYAAIGMDTNGRNAINWGLYGVPETFVVDGEGVVRYKFVGILTDEVVSSIILPQIKIANNK